MEKKTIDIMTAVNKARDDETIKVGDFYIIGEGTEIILSKDSHMIDAEIMRIWKGEPDCRIAEVFQEKIQEYGLLKKNPASKA